MLVVLDIGIANTLTNLVSDAFARDDHESAADYFNTAFFAMVGMVILLGLAGWLIWPHLNVGKLLNIHEASLQLETSLAIRIAFLLFLLGLPANLGARALGGYQELHFANLFTTAGSILAFFAIVIVIYLKGSLVALVGGYAGANIAASVACLLWTCYVHKPWLRPSLSRFQRRLLPRIFHSGGQFFAIQLAGLVVFNSDNIVISHFLSPAEVTPYNVTWKLANYATMFQIVASSAVWPAYSEAWARGDIGWIRKTYRRIRWMTIGTLALACAVLIPYGKVIIRIWAGAVAVPSSSLLLLMCIWMALYAITSNQSCLMGATTRVGKQAFWGTLGAAANLALTLWWVRTMGTVGVILGTVVSYVVFILLVQMWEVRSVLRTDFDNTPPPRA